MAGIGGARASGLRNEVEQWSGKGPAEPRKAGKNALLCIFPHEFSMKTRRIAVQTDDAASMPLLVLVIGENAKDAGRFRRTGHSGK